MFYRSVVLEKGKIVNHGFDAKDLLEFVIHFDRDCAHVMFDSGAFNADIVIVANLPLVVCMQLTTKERG